MFLDGMDLGHRSSQHRNIAAISWVIVNRPSLLKVRGGDMQSMQPDKPPLCVFLLLISP